jgi:hypothetical protein
VITRLLAVLLLACGLAGAQAKPNPAFLFRHSMCADVSVTRCATGSVASLLARSFNGTSDKLVSAANVDLSSTKLISVFMRLKWDSYSNDFSSVLWHADQVGHVQWAVVPNGTGGVFTLYKYNDTRGSSGFSFTRPAPGTHDYLFVIDNSNVGNEGVSAAYVDGLSVSGYSALDNSGGLFFALGLLEVMGRAAVPVFSSGAVSDIWIWKTNQGSNALALHSCNTDPATVDTSNILAGWPIKQVTPETPGSGGGSVNLTVTGTTGVPSYCGSTPTFIQSATGSSGGPNLSVSITPTAGNTLLTHFVYRLDSVSVTSVKDSANNPAALVFDSGMVGSHYAQGAYCQENIPSGVTAVNLVFSGSGANVSAEVQEWSNLSCAAIGTQSSNQGNNLTPVTSGSITPTSGDRGVLFCADELNNGGGGSPAFSASGFTNYVEAGGNPDGSYAASASKFIPSASGSSYTCTSSWSGGGFGNVAIFGLRSK